MRGKYGDGFPGITEWDIQAGGGGNVFKSDWALQHEWAIDLLQHPVSYLKDGYMFFVDKRTSAGENIISPFERIIELKVNRKTQKKDNDFFVKVDKDQLDNPDYRNHLIRNFYYYTMFGLDYDYIYQPIQVVP